MTTLLVRTLNRRPVRVLLLALLTLLFTLTAASLGLPDEVQQPAANNYGPIVLLPDLREDGGPVSFNMDLIWRDPVRRGPGPGLVYGQLQSDNERTYVVASKRLAGTAFSACSGLERLDRLPGEFGAAMTPILGGPESNSNLAYFRAGQLNCRFNMADLATTNGSTLLISAPEILVGWNPRTAPGYYNAARQPLKKSRPKLEVSVVDIPSEWQVAASDSHREAFNVTEFTSASTYRWNTTYKSLTDSDGAVREEVIQSPSVRVYGTSLIGAASQSRNVFYSGVLLGLAGSALLLTVETALAGGRQKHQAAVTQGPVLKPPQPPVPPVPRWSMGEVLVAIVLAIALRRRP